MSEQVTSLTPEQRRQVFDVLERLWELIQHYSPETTVVLRRSSQEHRGRAVRVSVAAEGMASISPGLDIILAWFHRIQEPPPPLPRRREWYWDLARPADPEELEQAIAIIRSLEVGL